MDKQKLIEMLDVKIKHDRSGVTQSSGAATIAVDMFWPLVEAAVKVDQLRPMNISLGIGPATAFRELGVVLSNLTGNSR